MVRTLNKIRSQCSRSGRTAQWLPWLIVAVALAWLVWPNPITASRLVYQSAVMVDDESPPPEASPVQQPPTEQPPPKPKPPATEAHGAETPPPKKPAAPATVAPKVGATPTAPKAPRATEAPGARPNPPPAGPLVDQPDSSPKEKPSAPGATPWRSQATAVGSVINWSKFWDTVVVVVAYPWLCCGIVLLLGLPLGLLLLEIKGRRRPRKLPEMPGRRIRPRGPGPAA